MSTERPINPEASDSTADVSESEASSQKVSSGGDATRAVDEQLIEETKQQIRGLVREIAQLAQSDISVEEFYAGFLGRVVSALAADGGAIWMDGTSAYWLREVLVVLNSMAAVASPASSKPCETSPALK